MLGVGIQPLTLKGALCSPCRPMSSYTVVNSGTALHAVFVLTVPSGSPELFIAFKQNNVSLPSSNGHGSKLPFIHA